MTTVNNMENKQNNEIIIKVEDLTVAYEDKPVLWDVELNVKKGVLMAIVGPKRCREININQNNAQPYKACYRRSPVL